MAEFNQDPRASGPVITGFTAHGFKLDGDNLGPRRVESSLVLTPVSAMPWNAPAIDALGIAAMDQVLAMDPPPEFMLLGTGPALAHPPRAFIRAMEERGIGVEAMDSRAAARAWGILRSEDRWFAAAIMAI